MSEVYSDLVDCTNLFRLQAAAWLLVLISAYCWAFATQYESVMFINSFVIQLQSRLKCGLCSTACYDVTLVKDVLICEVRTAAPNKANHFAQSCS